MNENGMKWARFGLVAGVVASVAGNVANACLTESSVSVLLRVPMAVVWPMFLFIAVEVLVRNRAVRGWLARIGQAGLLTITVPTAITSFVNLHALMIKAGEPGIATTAGPVAIDGLMLGCTIMMLAARVVSVDTPDMTPHVLDTPDMPAMTEQDIDRWVADIEAEVDIWGRLSEDMSSAPTRPVPVVPNAPVSPAGPRLDNIPADAVSLIRAWDSADMSTRPAAPEARALLAAEFGRSDKTIKRWMSTVLGGRA